VWKIKNAAVSSGALTFWDHGALVILFSPYLADVGSIALEYAAITLAQEVCLLRSAWVDI